MGQLSFSNVEYEAKHKKTRREIFFAEVDSVVPREQLIKLIEPVNPKFAEGKAGYELSPMVRVCCMQR
jgi:IS5 family transposase